MTPPIFASTRWELVDQGRGYCCKQIVKMLGHLDFIKAGVAISTKSYTSRLSFINFICDEIRFGPFLFILDLILKINVFHVPSAVLGLSEIT